MIGFERLSRIAVTGASGMVGRALLAQLSALGIVALSSSRTAPTALAGAAEWRQWDLSEWRNASTLDTLFPGAQALIHAGAAIPGHGQEQDTPALIDINVRATLALGEWASLRNLPLVFLSSATVYAAPERSGIHEDDPTGANAIGGAYALTKRLAEEALRTAPVGGPGIVILRPSSIYGPGLPPRKTLVRFLRSAAAGETIILSPPADDRHDLIHAHDVARACVAALERGARGVFNIASECPVTLIEMAEACVRATGRGRVAIAQGPAQRAAVTRFGLDCAKAHTAFGFTPRIGLTAGVAELWRTLMPAAVVA